MIITTVTLLSILFFGGGGLDILGQLEKMSGKVEKIVADEARAEQARVALDAMGTEYAAFASEVRESREAVRALDLRYDTTAEEYEAAFESLLAAWTNREAQVLERRAELQSATTREEWDELHEGLRKKVAKLTEKRMESESGDD